MALPYEGSAILAIVLYWNRGFDTIHTALRNTGQDRLERQNVPNLGSIRNTGAFAMQARVRQGILPAVR